MSARTLHRKPAAKESRAPAASRKRTKYRMEKTPEQLAAEQGVKPQKWEEVVGMGADLWDSDDDCEQFVKEIYERRKQDLKRENRT